MLGAFEFASLNEFLRWLQSEDWIEAHPGQICVGKLRSNKGYSVALFAGTFEAERVALTQWMDANLSRFREFRIWTNRSDALNECEIYFKEVEQPQEQHRHVATTKHVNLENECDDCGRVELQKAMDAMEPPSRCSLDRAAQRRNRCGRR